MKYKLFVFAILLFLLSMLLFPKAALDGSTAGLLLWFHTVLPTLLPFLIITEFIRKLNAIHLLCRFFVPLTSRLFHIETYGCYSLITGLICGYPMGAKTTADLVREGLISTEEGNYLLGICNNASPMFFLGFVLYKNLHIDQPQSWILFLIFYATPLLYAYFTRPDTPYTSFQSLAHKPHHISFEIIDTGIMNAFETVTRLGGYIILFSMIAKMVTACMHTVTIPSYLLIGFIEITNGVHILGTSSLPDTCKIPLMLAITCFGGLSGLAQTRSMIQGTNLSIVKYICVKCILTLLSLLLSLLYCALFIT